MGIKTFSLVGAIARKNVKLSTNYSFIMINKSTTTSPIRVAKSLTP